jgi:hypothetical protein
MNEHMQRDGRSDRGPPVPTTILPPKSPSSAYPSSPELLYNLKLPLVGSLPVKTAGAVAVNHIPSEKQLSYSTGPDVGCTSPPRAVHRRPVTGAIPVGTAVYEGPYNDYGEKHGQGDMFWSNGDVFQESFVNNVREGHGTLTFGPSGVNKTDGGEHVGDWRNNHMHGSGTRRYPNGDVFMGQYEYGKRHGDGRFYYANGDLYWGNWCNNQMHREGRYYYLSGQRFEGIFISSKRNGKGKLQWTDGTFDVFQYINDQRVGQGVRWSADRSKAWRLWTPMTGRTGQSACGSLPEKRSISIAEAVSLVYEIEQAAASNEEAMTSSAELGTALCSC